MAQLRPRDRPCSGHLATQHWGGHTGYGGCQDTWRPGPQFGQCLALVLPGSFLLLPGHAGQRAAVESCRTWAGSQHSGSLVACTTGHRYRGLEPCSSPLLQAQWVASETPSEARFTAGWSDEARVALRRSVMAQEDGMLIATGPPVVLH